MASRFTQIEFRLIQTLTSATPLDFSNFRAPFSVYSRNFCSNNRINSDDDDDDDENEAEGSEDDERVASVQGKSDEEKTQEANEIGYKVIGPLQESDRVFKPYEPVFAVVQVFIVS